MLISIRNREEQEFIENLFSSKQISGYNIWIGAEEVIVIKTVFYGKEQILR